MQSNYGCPAFSKFWLVPKISATETPLPNQACFCLFREIPMLTFDSTFAFPSRPEFQDQVQAVSTLNDAVQCHQNTLKRKTRCTCWWALFVLLGQENFRKPSSDWSEQVTPQKSLCNCHPYTVLRCHSGLLSLLGFGYSLWIFKVNFLMNSGVLNTIQKLHLLDFVPFAQWSPLHVIQKLKKIK